MKRFSIYFTTDENKSVDKTNSYDMISEGRRTEIQSVYSYTNNVKFIWYGDVRRYGNVYDKGDGSCRGRVEE